MTIEQIKHNLIADLTALCNVAGFELILKPYSKSYYGRYIPKHKRIVLYVYKDSNLQELYSYEELFSTALHEYTHHIQWCDPNFKRVKGIMHNAQFYEIFNRLMEKHNNNKA